MARRCMSREQELLAQVAQPHTDRLMAPEAMRRHLIYQLSLVEYRIGGAIRRLEQPSRAPYPSALDDASIPEQVWASWASLSYLLQARDNLKAALTHEGRS